MSHLRVVGPDEKSPPRPAPEPEPEPMYAPPPRDWRDLVLPLSLCGCVALGFAFSSAIEREHALGRELDKTRVELNQSKNDLKSEMENSNATLKSCHDAMMSCDRALRWCVSRER